MLSVAAVQMAEEVVVTRVAMVTLSQVQVLEWQVLN
jgi:hypothetical protein